MHTNRIYDSEQLGNTAEQLRRTAAEEVEELESSGDGTTVVPVAEPTDPLASLEPMISHWRWPTSCEPELGVTAVDLLDIADATWRTGNAIESLDGTENPTVRDTLPSPPPSLEDLAS